MSSGLQALCDLSQTCCTTTYYYCLRLKPVISSHENCWPILDRLDCCFWYCDFRQPGIGINQYGYEQPGTPSSLRIRYGHTDSGGTSLLTQ